MISSMFQINFYKTIRTVATEQHLEKKNLDTSSIFNFFFFFVLGASETFYSILLIIMQKSTKAITFNYGKTKGVVLL